jgi:hypothetical protein
MMSPREFELRLHELLAQALGSAAADGRPLPRYELDQLVGDLVRAYDEMICSLVVVQ